MKYQGSKNRHAKELLPIILKDRKGQYFYDLFCGGGNICDKVDGSVVANDYNPYVIKALELIRDKIEELANKCHIESKSGRRGGFFIVFK